MKSAIKSACMRAFAFIAAILLSTHAWAAIDFGHDVQPLLKARCLGCHGAKLQMHGLRLDVKTAAFKGGESGVPAIVPGNSVQSLLIKYISANSDVVMPPSGPRLTADQVSMLRVWIDSGASWPDETATTAE